jgi:hypothetical protein
MACRITSSGGQWTVRKPRVDEMIDGAIASYVAAKANADYWGQCCAEWTEANGLGVWREGHPTDRRKLFERRRARDALRVEQERLRDALAAWVAEKQGA